MKKIVFALLVTVLVCLAPREAHAVDWSQYESIRDNVRLEGFQSMPGYMAFGDGDGNILGYIWMSPGKGLVWCSATNGTSYTAGNNPNDNNRITGAINLRTTKLTNDFGVPISSEWTGGIGDGVMY